MRRGLVSAIVVLAVLLTVVPVAHAALERVGPVTAATGGYPAWYQDKTGLALEFCTPINQAELNSGWCTILPADVPTGVAPETPFTNFSEEHFYWIASAGARTGGQLVLALEGAFAVGPAIPGDQIVFGRLRITHTNLPVSGDYKVYTPFGDFDFPGMTAGQKLFFTSDIGINGGGFEAALNSQIGPFLLPSATSGGTEVPPIPDLLPGQDPFYDTLVTTATATPYPATGKKYIADPVRIGPVTGSPLPPFTSPVDGLVYDHNRFRIEVNGTLVLDEPNFSLGGRVMTASIPGRVTVNRASYAASATGNKLDVFATATHTVQGRVPGATVTPPAAVDLGYYDAPCATDPTTGAAIGPPATPGLQYFQMFNDGASNWWGQNAPVVIPPQVCVQDLNARDAAGNIVPAYFLGNVADAVRITWASVMWDPSANGGTLTVSAASSDTTATPPVLTLSGYTVPFTDPLTGVVTQVPAVIGATGTVAVSPLGAPPAKVTVISSRGGVASLDTTTGVGTPVSPITPVANADSVTTPEDTQAVNINVLANDTLAGGPLPTGATVAISAQGRLGTAVVNVDNTITYTPTLNLNGTDIIGYKVTVGTAVSPEGYLTVIITPVNDPPTAVNDTGGAPNNKAVTLGLLANDTDPDGAADLAAAVIVTLPAAGATLTCNGGVATTVGTECAGGLVTFTATAAGTYSFTYRAKDQAGALSANTANVSITSATENIVVSKSQYVVSKNRWVVTGTDNTPAGQTLSIAYSAGANGGTYKVNGVCTGSAAGVVIGTAPVDALGNWVLDAILTSAGVLNPSNTGGNSTGFWCTPPKSITVTSPLGAVNSANITLK